MTWKFSFSILLPHFIVLSVTNGLLRMNIQWLGFLLIMKKQTLGFFQLIKCFIKSSPANSLLSHCLVFLDNRSWNRTQYCFTSSGFGESFIGSKTPERKRRPSWRTNRAELSRETCFHLRSVLSRWHVSAMPAVCTCACSAFCDWLGL